MNREELLAILELSKDASESDIEDSYFKLTKRVKNEENLDVDKITEAYRKLTGKEKRTEEEKVKGKRKVNRKLFLIGSGVVLAFIVFISSVNYLFTNETVNINYMGAFNNGKFNQLGLYIKESKEIKTVAIDEIRMFGESAQLLQKDMNGNILFLSEFENHRMDIFVLDDFTYNYFKDENIFVDLTEYLDEIGISKNDESLLIYDNKVIAIDMTKNHQLSSPYYSGMEMYVAVGKNHGKINKCIETIKLLLE